MSVFSNYKKLLLCLLSVVVIYAAQFLILPAFLTQFYPQSNEAAALLVVPILAMVVIGVLCFHVRIKTWLAADVLYGILLCVYHGRGLYGIGLRGVMLDGMSPIYSFRLALLTILLLLAVMVITQVLLCLLCDWVCRKRNK